MVPSQDGYIKFGGLEDVFIETISTWISAQGSLGGLRCGRFRTVHATRSPANGAIGKFPASSGWVMFSKSRAFFMPWPQDFKIPSIQFPGDFLVKVYIHNKLENHHFIAGKIHETSTGPWLQVRKLWMFTRPGTRVCTSAGSTFAEVSIPFFVLTFCFLHSGEVRLRWKKERAPPKSISNWW